MGFSCGIVGLPNAGKSTVFNALTAAGSPVAPYAFCTIDPKEGVVAVPDPRLRTLAGLLHPERTTPTTLTFVDIAGLVKGASRGEGLGNRFLGHIREVDAVVFVLRAFEDENVSHVAPVLDPWADLETVRTELLLADLETVRGRLERQIKAAKVGDKEARAEVEFLESLAAHLDRGAPARTRVPGSEREAAWRDGLFLLTVKPALLVANIGEGELPGGGPLVEALRTRAAAEGLAVIPVCGKLEMDLAGIEDPGERSAFMTELGFAASALDRVVTEGYRLLELITFYTPVGPELRAWTIPRGTTAGRAAGRIHSDMERGFIRAEITSFEDFVAAGSEARARERGLARAEGRDYVMQDGDVARVHFRA
ncbi:MAG: redox-regulated ATPase YchF [Deltaproteobacteria bacterium]|nr:redox-regulated ATPase YchF [Deltaproteobacteria bacterium]